MNIDLTPIFQAIIALLAALITFKLIPWLKGRSTEQQMKNLTAAAQIAAYAAEQLYGAGNGEQKLDYAIAKLKGKGYHLEKGEIREAIEAAVFQINNGLAEEVPVLIVEEDEDEEVNDEVEGDKAE